MMNTVLLDNSGYVIHVWRNASVAAISKVRHPGQLREAPREVCSGWKWNGKRWTLPRRHEAQKVDEEGVPVIEARKVWPQPQQETPPPLPKPKPMPVMLPPEPPAMSTGVEVAAPAPIAPRHDEPPLFGVGPELVAHEPDFQTEMSWKDIVTRVDGASDDDVLGAPADDEPDRVEAKRKIKEAARNAAILTLDDQIRYELAMQAINGSIYAIDLFQGEARELGTTVEALARSVVGARRGKEKLMMRIHEIAARITTDLDATPAMELAAAVQRGIAEIDDLTLGGM